jgi:hypothetical protein
MVAPLISDGSMRAAVVALAALTAAWVVAFSSVDFAKELPAFHWVTTCAIVIGGADVVLVFIRFLGFIRAT